MNNTFKVFSALLVAVAGFATVTARITGTGITTPTHHTSGATLSNPKTQFSLPQQKTVAGLQSAPLVFTENKGQVTDQNHSPRTDIQFKMAATAGLNIFVGNGAIHYQFCKNDDPGELDVLRPLNPKDIRTDQKKSSYTLYRMDVELVGANKNAQIITDGKQEYYENYLTPGTGENGVTASTYKKITYKDIYPNIDWVLYAGGNQLKHEFVVRQGGKVSDIKLKYGGATDLKISKNGNLIANTPQGNITEEAPYTYQKDRKSISSKYVLTGDVLSYETGNYTGELVIDPTLAWATYYGGSGTDRGYGVSTDASGNVYMAGYTDGSTGLATSGAYQITYAGGAQDGFVVKFNSAGVRQWATYYGGTGDDYVRGCATDGNGNIYVTGYTTGTSGIATTGAFQTSFGGSYAAFLVKFNTAGARQWATYYGGSVNSIANGVTIDGIGNIYLTGQTSDITGIATSGAYQTTYGGSYDAFVVKFDSTGARHWATYYGGSSNECGYAVAYDGNGSIYLSGISTSTSGIATSGAYQTAYAGGTGYDGILVKFDTAGVRQWATYFGGSAEDDPYAVKTDNSGNVYIAGSTESATGIATTGAYLTTFSGSSFSPECFLAKFNGSGAIQWSTYYGGSYGDDAYGLATDVNRNVYMSGLCSTPTGLSTSGAYQPAFGGGIDAFIVQFDSTGARTYATYYGGTGDEVAMAMCSDGAGNIYLTGNTTTTSGFATSGACQTSFGGTRDAFLSKFSNFISPITGVATVCVGSTTTLSDASGGGTWTSGSIGIATVGSSSGIVTGVTAGTAVITYTTGGGSVFVTVTVNSAPSAGTILGSSSVCSGGTISLTDATTGGTWSSSNTAIATVNTSGVVTSVSGGSTTISYSITSSCGTAVATKSITVNAPITAFTATPNPVCIGSAVTFSSSAPLCSGNALSYNGSTSSVSLGSVISTATSNVTMEAWVYWDGTATAQTIVLNGNTGSSGYGIINYSGNIHILCGGILNMTSGFTLTANTWTHLAAVCNSSHTWTLYINGSPTSLIPSSSATPNTPTAGFYIGINNGGTWVATGIIDEVKFWNVERTSTQVQADMIACNATPQAGLLGYWKFDEGTGSTAFDASGHGNNLALANITWVTSTETLSTYSWNFGDAGTSIANNVAHTYLLTGIYTASLTVTNASGCTATATTSVTVGGGSSIITTIAGNGTSGFTGDGGAATSAEMNQTWGVATDVFGNVFIADANNNRIRKVNTAGVISTYAGNGTAGYLGDGSAATAAELNFPTNVKADAAGNIYIADFYNNRIRKVSTSGIITTYAGNGIMGYTGDGGQATAAEFHYPRCLVFDTSGNMYISDNTNHVIRKITSSGIISTIAGTGTAGYSGDGGAATAATMFWPEEVAVDNFGNVIFSDHDNSRVRKISTSGIITTIAGNGTGGYSGDGGAATAAQINQPSGLVIDSYGNYYIAEYFNNRIRKVSVTGIISTFAGNGTSGFSGDGGAATAATINTNGLGIDGSNNLYLSDYGNNRIRKISAGATTVAPISGASSVCLGSTITLSDATLSGTWSSSNTTVATINSLGVVTGISLGSTTISYSVIGSCSTVSATFAITIGGSPIINTITGNGTAGFTGDGSPATSGQINSAWQVAADLLGNIYIADNGNQRIRKINSLGVISTIAGTGTAGFSSDGVPATSSQLNQPTGVAVDNLGNIYIGDNYNNRVRKINTAGIISTIGGTGFSGFSGDGGPATSATLNPNNLVTDNSGNLYINDGSNHRIRKINSSGIITTIAGNGTSGFSGDGSAATAAQIDGEDVAVDNAGNVYICEPNNGRIRKVNIGTGIITTIAGTGLTTFNGDGILATAANLYHPKGIFVDATGNVYISESGNNRIRKIDATGYISTIGGTGSSGHSGDGGPATAGLVNHPYNLTLDINNNIYFTDSLGNYVRKITSGNTTVFPITGSASICLGAPTTLADATSGGTWSSSNTGIATISTTGVVTGVSAGTTTISYSVTGTCGSAVATLAITVNGGIPIITSIAGNGSNTFSGDGGPATAASFLPYSVVADAAGNIYISDYGNNRIRKINTAGIISTIAGSSAGYSGDGGPATAAQLHNPTGIAIDAAGNIYVPEHYNNCVRKINTSGIITTIAGNGSYGFSGDGGAAVSAQLSSIWGVGVDASGNVYIPDYENHRIRKVNTSGIISTIAGTGSAGFSGDGGAAVSAQFNHPNEVYIDGTGNIYITDYDNDRVRKINTSGIISTIAGNGINGFTGDGGQATAAEIDHPSGVTTDATGNIYISDQVNNRIRIINTSGIINTYTGSGAYGSGTGTFSGDGGAATAATLNNNTCINFDAFGNLLIADQGNNHIRKVSLGTYIAPITGISTICIGTTTTLADATSGGTWSSGMTGIATINSSGVVTGVSAGSASISYTVTGVCGSTVAVMPITVNGTALITTVAGNGIGGYTGDGGAATGAEINAPSGVAVDGSGYLYIADQSNNRIRKVSPTGIISTVAGNGTAGFSGDGGSAASAQLNTPYGLVIDTSGNLYISDDFNFRIRKVTPTGTITTIAGNGFAGFSGDGGPATAAQLNGINQMAVDNNGNLYFADFFNNRIRKVSSSGIITTVAGNGIGGFSSDGIQATASELHVPEGVAVDAAGNLYIADGNYRIRKVNTSGIISTIAGTGTLGYSGDGGAATAAMLAAPSSVRVDAGGNVYFTDQSNNRVRKINTSGIIATLSGNGTGAYSGDGGNATAAQISSPYDVALDVSGNIYVADLGNNRVRKIYYATTTVAPITGSTSICMGASTSLSDATTGGVWSSGNTAIATVNTSGVITGISSGTVSISYSVTGTCGTSVATLAVTINALPSAGTITGTPIVCVGSTTTLADVATGGTYIGTIPTVGQSFGGGVVAYLLTSSDPGYSSTVPKGIIAAPADQSTGRAWAMYNTFVPSSMAIGSGASNTTNMVSILGTPCAAYICDTLTLNGYADWYLPSANELQQLCYNKTAIGGFATGSGVYYWSSSQYLFSPYDQAYYLDFSDFSTCSINHVPQYDAFRIRAVRSFSLTSTTTWSSSNTAIATVNGSGIVTGIAPGIDTITYTVTNGLCTSSTTQVITVNAATSIATITGTAIVCPGSTTSLSDATSGGTWSSGSTGIATINTSGVVTGVSAGVATISYSVISSCGTGYSTLNITVNPLPSAGTITGLSAVCVSATISLSETASGGTWSSGTTSIVTINTSGVVTGVSVGTTTISYSLTNSCGTAITTYSITVNPLPNAGTITGTTTVCTGIPTTLVDTITGGIWSSSNTAITIVSSTGIVTGVDAGIATISYTITNSCGISTAIVGVMVGTFMINTVAGNGTIGYTGDGGIATSAELNFPTGVAPDLAGNFYIADNINNVVRKVSSSGIITTFAGTGVGGYTGDGGQATAARLQWVTNIKIDKFGNIYLVQQGANVIRKINTLGIISTVAGNGITGYSGDGGAATSAQFNTVTSIAIDTLGNIYIVDPGNQRIRKVNSSGIVNTIVGNGTAGYSGDGGQATAAMIHNPDDIIIDRSGNIYITDLANNVIRKINPLGIISTIAGTGTPGYSGDGGAATASELNNPYGLAFDVAGDLYISDFANHRIRMVNTQGIISTIAGNGSSGYLGDGGLALSAQFHNLAFISTDTSNNIYIADEYNHRIRKLTLNNTIISAISGFSTVCQGSVTTLTDTIPGGSWSSASTSIATVNTSGIVTGVSVGTTTISYSITNSCGTATTTYSITVNPLPNAGTITGLSAVCVSAVTSLSETASGGTWSSSNTTIATVGTTGITTGVSIGTATISYTYTNSCGTDYATTIVTVNPLPSAGTITGLSAVCMSATTSLSDGISGGLWSSASTGIATVNTSGVVTGVSVGTTTISYSITNSCGTATTTYSITVNPLPNADTITGLSAVCVSAVTSLSETASGGTWSSSNTTIATVGTTGITTGVSTGTATISYTYTNSCGTDYATTIVTVNPLPNAGTITGLSAVCVSATTSLSDGISGGSWSSASIGIATVNTSGVVTGVSVGSTTISYSITNSCGTATTTYSITVNPLPNAGTITGLSAVCVSAVTSLSETASGGTWSSSNTTIATVGTTGITTGVSIGTVTISYTYTNSCGTDYATTIVTVNPLPSAGTIAGLSSVCMSATTSLSDGISGGTWSSATTSIATIGTTGIVTGVSAGTTAISYTVTNSCGTAIATAIVTVNPLPSAGTITGTTTVCAGSVTSLTDITTGGTWSSSNTSIATVGTTGITTGVTAGTATISYTFTNVCGTDYTTTSITVNPLPNAGTISGVTTICATSMIFLTDGAGSGTWSSTSTGIATVGTTGIVTGVSAGTSAISYTVTNSCGTAIATAIVTVNPLPYAGTITGTSMVCAGSNTSLYDGSGAGTWSSGSTGIATIGSTGVVTGIAAGVVTITYSVTNGCGSDFTTYLVTVNPMPSAGVITGTASVCISSVTLLSDTATGGIWSSGAPGIAGISTTGLVTGVSAGTATITYFVTNSCGTVFTTQVVTVNTTPSAGTISGFGNVCLTSSITLSDGVTGGSWSSINSLIASIDNYGVVTGNAVGSTTISYTVSTACGSSYAIKTVTVNPLTDAGTITGTTGVCIGGITTLSNTVTGGTWSSGTTSIATINFFGVVTGVTAGIANISYSKTTSCGTAVTTTQVTVYAPPTSVIGTPLLCVSSTTTLSDATTIGTLPLTWSSSNSSIATVGSTTGIVTGILAGVVNISFTNGCGYATKLVTVNGLPSVISGITSVCAGNISTLFNATSGGTWSSSSTGIATIGSTNGILDGMSAGIATIMYDNGCSPVAITTVTVNALPAIISGSSVVCYGSTTTLSDSVSGGNWSETSTAISVSGSGVVTGVSLGIGTVTYTLPTGCFKTKSLTVNPLPIAGNIIGNDSLCQLYTITLSDTGASSSGTWSVLNSSVATISSVGIVTGHIADTVSIIYSVTNLCGTANSTKLITVKPQPDAGTILGLDSLCAGTSILLTDAISGGTWSASNTNATVSLTGTILGVSGGYDTIIYTVSNTCGSAMVIKSIYVKPLATAGTLSGPDSVCTSANITIVSTSTGGTWSSSNTKASITSGTSSSINVTGVEAGIDTIIYTAMNTCDTSIATKTIIIKSQPNAGTISGGDSVCTGATLSLSETVTGGNWHCINAHASVLDGVVTGISKGLDTIVYSISNYCGTDSTTKKVYVKALPVAGTILGNDSMCVGSPITLTDAIGGGVWSSSNSNATVTGGIVNAISSGLDTISYIVSNTCGTAIATKKITILQLADAGTITGATEVCIGSAITLSESVLGGYWTSTNTSVATVLGGIVTGISLGIDTIKYNISNYCGISSKKYGITVSTHLFPSLTGSNMVCIDEKSDTLQFSPLGGTWSVSNTNATVINGIVTGVAPGNAIVTYSVSNICGTTDTTITITIYTKHQCDSINYVYNVPNESEGIKIYPNPANDMFTIEYNGTSNDIAVAIMDMYGKIIISKEHLGLVAGRLAYNAKGLSAGTYMVRVIANNRIYREKLVIINEK